MAAIEIDRTTWPVVVIRFPSSPGDDSFLTYLAALGRLGDAGEPYATISDLGPMRAPITPRQRRAFDDWMERTSPALAPLAAANAIVAPTPLARAIARTVYWNWRDPPCHRVFDDVASARRWCERRLRLRAGRTARVEPAARGRQPAPVSEIVGLVDLIREPAYLVDTTGDVVFANRAAVRSRVPAELLVKVQSVRPEAGELPVQILRVDLDGRALRLVIFDQGIALAGLPPSLRRVALRLARGESDRQIAQATGLSLASVRTYVRRLYARTEVRDRRELMRRWMGGA